MMTMWSWSSFLHIFLADVVFQKKFFVLLSRTIAELLKRDPSIINDEDEASNTPLHLAASEGHVKCCKALLENGAEVDAR